MPPSPITPTNAHLWEIVVRCGRDPLYGVMVVMGSAFGGGTRQKIEAYNIREEGTK